MLYVLITYLENVLDIACWRFSSMSFSNFLILSMYDASWGDGWNDLSMFILQGNPLLNILSLVIRAENKL